MASAIPDVEVEVPSPLRECILHCEVDCVRECCGINAISQDAGLIAGWSREVGPTATSLALRQIRGLLVAVEDRSHKVSSVLLNHYTCDEAARGERLSFLRAFESALEGSAEQNAAADRPGE
jgi:hypothetical protein